MINNNYVPDWYYSPFDHTQYTLVRNQDQLDILFDDMSESEKFLSMGCPAQVDYLHDGEFCIVHLGDTSEKSPIVVQGLLIHESVHIWQRVKTRMGEKEPSTEFEAYSIQRIAQDLLHAYQLSECDD